MVILLLKYCWILCAMMIINTQVKTVCVCVCVCVYVALVLELVLSFL